MYDNLVNRFRERAECFDYDGRPDIACDEEAADAIEQLSKYADTIVRLGDDYDGLKVKYIVFKSSNGEIVDDCFVLRPDRDKAAIAALNAYADATENQVLESDIRKWLSTIISADPPEEETE